MSKHTPGPWKLIGQTDSGVSWVCPADSEDLCDGFATVWSNGKDNARLIASVPDLLEALQLSVKLYEQYGLVAGVEVDGVTSGAWVNKARAAINKATGEQQ